MFIFHTALELLRYVRIGPDFDQSTCEHTFMATLQLSGQD